MYKKYFFILVTSALLKAEEIKMKISINCKTYNSKQNVITATGVM